jgi:hypothetical protein
MAAGMESMASQGTKSSVLPLATRGVDVPDYENPQPSTFSYLLGADILVHPVLNEKSAVEMTFPAAESGPEGTAWLNWWAPLDRSSRVQGRQEAFTQWAHPDMSAYPVYVRQGAFLPLQTSPGIEDAVFTWFAPDNSATDLTRSARVPQPASIGPGIEGTASLSKEGIFTGTVSAHPAMQSGFKVLGVSRPESKTVDPAVCSFEYVEESATLSVSCSDTSQGVIVSATGVFPAAS